MLFFHAYIFLLRKRLHLSFNCRCERNFSKNYHGFQLSKSLLVENFYTKKKFEMRDGMIFYSKLIDISYRISDDFLFRAFISLAMALEIRDDLSIFVGHSREISRNCTYLSTAVVRRIAVRFQDARYLQIEFLDPIAGCSFRSIFPTERFR